MSSCHKSRERCSEDYFYARVLNIQASVMDIKAVDKCNYFALYAIISNHVSESKRHVNIQQDQFQIIYFQVKE